MINKKGQVALEGLIALMLTVPLSLVFVFSILFISLDVCINDILDSFLFCKVQNKENCESNFKESLIIQKIKERKVTYRRYTTTHGDVYQVRIRGLILNQYHYTKERKFVFQKSI